MKIYFIITFLFSTIYFSFSQNSEIDSIYIELKKINNDTSKVNYLNNKFLQYEFSNPVIAEKFVKSALELSIQVKFNRGKAESYTYLGFFNDDKGSYDKAITYFSLAGNIYKNLKDENSLANSYNYIGTSYKSISEYLKALDYIYKALNIYLKNNNIKGIATAYNNLGITYFAKNDFPNALEYFIKSVKIFEKTNNEYGIAACYCNIANIYKELDKNNEAIDYYNKAIDLNIKIGQKNWEAVNYHSLGTLYGNLNKYEKAFEYLQKALLIRKNIGDKYGEASTSASIGTIYESIDSSEVALEYFNYSSEIFAKSGAMNEYAGTLNSISMILLKQKKTKECEPLVNRLIEIAENIKLNNILLNAYTCKSLLCEQSGELKESIQYLKLVNQYKDSLYIESKQKVLTEMGEKYDTDQKESKIKLLQKDKKLQDLELEKQRNYRNYLIMFGLLVSIIIVVLFISFQIKRKSNRKLRLLNSEIMQQKEEIETQRDEIITQRDEIEKHRDIILEQKEELHDSITYARRIQEAVLPISIESRAVLGEHFIMFWPKDIVSGDFYWVAKIENTLIVTVADCTGHGVPGAFMSMLGISFLNEIVRKKEIIKANDVLNELRKEIINALQQKGESGEQKDGMDISLIAIKTQDPSPKSQVSNSKLQEEESEKVKQGESENEADNNQSSINNNQSYNAQWAGANNPLWIVRNSKEMPPFEKVASLGEGAVTQSSGLLLDEVEILLSDEPAVIERIRNEVRDTELTNQRFVLHEIKPDKMPIAIYLKMNSFTNNEIILQKGDLIYLMSDGYEDQFGGLKEKKFLSKNLKNLLVENSQKPMNEQKEILETTMVNWIGNGQQIDDITIVGLKL